MDIGLTASTAFLSYLRLSVYMSVVSIAIILSFHLKEEPSDFELHMALPLGIVFWCLGMLCLALGFGNYVKTVTLYSRRTALVQTGWKTQTVSHGHFGAYCGGADWVLDIWDGSGEYSRGVHPVLGYEFDERLMISPDGFTRVVICLRRLEMVGYLHALTQGHTIPWCGTTDYDLIYRAASRAIYQMFHNSDIKMWISKCACLL
jgi:hypothetical protein